MAVAPCPRLLSAFTPPRSRPAPSFSTHRTQIAHPPSPPSPNPLSLPPSHARLRLRRRPLLTLFSVPENGGASETLDEASSSSASAEKEDDEEKPNTASASASASAASSVAESAVAEELKEMMRARRKEGELSPSSDLWGGVLEEIREIEWPAFGKVVGTTGVVLAVIAGSTVALLTVNAVLAEISDRAFAGKGIQDIFG